MEFSTKYQNIRKRFIEKFYYKGHVSEFIEEKRIKFADQTIYMGQTLILFATEVYIKRRIGENPESSIQKIKEIFAAIDQLDLAAEQLYGHSAELNGFIARDNITGVNDPRLNSRFEQVDSDWQKPEDAAPSGDQIFGLMAGLWFTVKYSEDNELIEQAMAIADRVFVHVKEQKFELKLPNGEDVKRGGDIRWLSSLLHGLNYSITGKDRFGECRIDILGIEFKLNPVAAFWDNVGDEAAQLLQTKVSIPLLGEQAINSFAAHIMLMAIAPTEIWTKQQFEKAALSVNHHFAVLVYSISHNELPGSFGVDDIESILDKCPNDGPRSDLSVETGWQKDNRWIRCSNIDTPGSGHKEYNGVDFLILHNLAQMIFH